MSEVHGAEIRWQKTGVARVVTFGENDALSVASTVSAAPGTPLEGSLAADPEPLALRLKVHRCRRQPDGSFVIEGKLVNPTRGLRVALRPGAATGDGHPSADEPASDRLATGEDSSEGHG